MVETESIPSTMPKFTASGETFCSRFLDHLRHSAKLSAFTFISIPKRRLNRLDAEQSTSLCAWKLESPKTKVTSAWSGLLTIFSQSAAKEELEMLIQGACVLRGSSGGGGIDGPLSSLDCVWLSLVCFEDLLEHWEVKTINLKEFDTNEAKSVVHIHTLKFRGGEVLISWIKKFLVLYTYLWHGYNSYLPSSQRKRESFSFSSSPILEFQTSWNGARDRFMQPFCSECTGLITGNGTYW